jgi:hypothetical protein
MNQELMDMAGQAGFSLYTLNRESNWKPLEAFAALVAEAEREKVAKQWEQWHGFDKHTVAQFIRARGASA